MENFWTYFEVLAPSIGVGLIFWFAMRAIFRADRRERAMEAKVRDNSDRTHKTPSQAHSEPHSTQSGP